MLFSMNNFAFFHFPLKRYCLYDKCYYYIIYIYIQTNLKGGNFQKKLLTL